VLSEALIISETSSFLLAYCFFCVSYFLFSAEGLFSIIALIKAFEEYIGLRFHHKWILPGCPFPTLSFIEE
jgi:hypothetical protein